jgi:hypothetical protein
VAAIVEQAIHDRRQAVTQNLVDNMARPSRPLNSVEAEIVTHLSSFFCGGGVEAAIEAGNFNIDIESIKRKSIEPLKRRKKG